MSRRILLRITEPLLAQVREDLRRPHTFAFERVGFIACRAGHLDRGGLILLATGYLPVADEDYIDDPNFGALMGPRAIRLALQHAYSHPVGMFHVHEHGGAGSPRFSRIDEREMPRFVPNFFNARPDYPHGALVLSDDGAAGYCWLGGRKGPTPFSRITSVGRPTRTIGGSDA